MVPPSVFFRPGLTRFHVFDLGPVYYKVGSDRRMTRLAACIYAVFYILILLLAQSGRLGQGTGQGVTIRACASAVVSSWLGQRGLLFSHLALFPRTTFLHRNEA